MADAMVEIEKQKEREEEEVYGRRTKSAMSSQIVTPGARPKTTPSNRRAPTPRRVGLS